MGRINSVIEVKDYNPALHGKNTVIGVLDIYGFEIFDNNRSVSFMHCVVVNLAWHSNSLNAWDFFGGLSGWFFLNHFMTAALSSFALTTATRSYSSSSLSLFYGRSKMSTRERVSHGNM